MAETKPDPEPPDPYPAAPRRREDPGRSRSGGTGCLIMGALSVLLLFVSVLGICARNDLAMGVFFFWLAVAAFVIALIIGFFNLLSLLTGGR